MKPDAGREPNMTCVAPESELPLIVTDASLPAAVRFGVIPVSAGRGTWTTTPVASEVAALQPPALLAVSRTAIV